MTVKHENDTQLHRERVEHVCAKAAVKGESAPFLEDLDGHLPRRRVLVQRVREVREVREMREVKGSMRTVEARLLLLLLRRSGSGCGGDCFFDSSDFGLDARLDPVKRIVMRTPRGGDLSDREDGKRQGSRIERVPGRGSLGVSTYDAKQGVHHATAYTTAPEKTPPTAPTTALPNGVKEGAISRRSAKVADS